MASCKDCVGYNFCSRKRDGETDYLGKEIGCGNVEDLCGDFKNKADIVPVVRCKDCKYCIDEGMSGLYCEHPDGRNTIHCRPDDYCNDGERKKE